MSSEHWSSFDIDGDILKYDGIAVGSIARSSGAIYDTDPCGHIWSVEGMSEDQIKDIEDGRL